jgi:ABC-type uncharacterized transport system permease subunit
VAAAEPEQAPSVAARLALWQRAGGVAAPLATVVLAFLIGGLAVFATGHDPLSTYRAIFNGTGLNWLFPWVTRSDRQNAAYNLQQTLLLTTPLILTGIAVAVAFRCGLFNIGGQGQYLVGVYFAVWIGSSWSGLPRPLHILVAVVGASLAGAVWAGIAGFLRAAVGAHEVITTIMLNWVAVWIGDYLFGLGGPLQSHTQRFNPVSSDIVSSAKLPVFWGDPQLQGLHVGFFVALAALVVYALFVNRTTLGFELRAVGLNAEAARYGGIPVRRSYFAAMAISGLFAGLAGALDLLGWQFRVATADIHASTIGFVGIAVALLGRNTAAGIGLAALLFGALVVGTSTRQLDPTVFDPNLASNLTLIIQGLVVLFIGASVLVLYLWRLRRGFPQLAIALPRRRGRDLRLGAAAPARAQRRPLLADLAGEALASAAARVPRGPKAVGVGAIAVAALAFWVALPPLEARALAFPLVLGAVAAAAGAWTIANGEKKLGTLAVAAAAVCLTGGSLATHSSLGHLETVVVWSALVAATLRFATPLVYAAVGGLFCERSGVTNIALEGMMLTGAFFGIWGADKAGNWALGLAIAVLAGGVLALVYAFFAIHLRADQIVTGTAINFLALGITGYAFISIYGDNGTQANISQIPDVSIPWLRDVYFVGPAFGQLNLMIWIALGILVATSIVVFRTPLGLRIRAVGEHPRAADTVGISVYAVRYVAVTLSGMLAALGGAYLSVGFVHSFNQNMTAGRGFIALAALIFGNWRPFATFRATLLFGFASALALRLPDAYGESAGTLFQTLPYVLTLIAVAGVIARSNPPAAVGRPYAKQ